MKSRLWTIIVLALSALAVAGAWLFVTQSAAPPQPDMTTAESTVVPRLADARATADQVLAALKANNGAALAQLVDQDGVRLSPSAFVDVADDQIDWYLSTGEHRDKAGAYGMQGAAGAFVSRIDGSPSNVIGLPLVETIEVLRSLGVAPQGRA